MEISNSFRVSAPPDATWDVLNDIERIAPCMPGAQLQGVEGDEYRGTVKVKLGPVTTQYRGTATFLERDPAARRAVLSAKGRETRGQGNASATVTATLHPDGGGTRVDILTDLTITGKAAQFGRGTFAEVSQKLLNQFAQQLEALLSQEPPAAEAAPSAGTAAAPTAGTTEPTTAAVPGADVGGQPAAEQRTITPPKPVEAIDLTALAGPAVAKRAAAAGAAVAVVLLLMRLVRRRR